VGWEAASVSLAAGVEAAGTREAEEDNILQAGSIHRVAAEASEAVEVLVVGEVPLRITSAPIP
jgi:hypothetical protein